jgi:two-component system, OmpR family, sensor kinase
MSLRRRLVIGVLVLVGVGLIAADIATYAALRSSLNGQVDDEVTTGLNQAVLVTLHPDISVGQIDARVDPNIYVMVFAPDGSLLSRPSGLNDPEPALPSLNNVPAVTFDPSGRVVQIPHQAFDVGSVGRSGVRYRAQAVVLPSGDTLVVARSLKATGGTLHRLLLIELVVTAAVLALLAALTVWVVRIGLRPLADMASTANEIAEGDLSQRVSPSSPDTEVGRLGLALNAMLAQIELAFDERSASEERLRRFIADASHELRTPLTSIRGYSELFRRGADRDPEGIERAMGRIEGEAMRMGTLVDDLLLLARLDQGRPLEQTPVDLSHLAEEAAADARVVDPGRLVTFDSSGPVVVLGDEDRLRQVAANLCSNALAHTPAGTSVLVRTGAAEGRAFLEVADEGEGLTAEKQALVFERFYRGDEARTRGGAGLGLSIVAAIASALGGRATVRSAVGQGATFRVDLPLAPSSGPDEDKAVPRSERGGSATGRPEPDDQSGEAASGGGREGGVAPPERSGSRAP